MSAATSRSSSSNDSGSASAVTQVPGLRHVDDNLLPGLRRRRTGKTVRVGKRFVETFVIEDASGARVTDADTLERIRKLAIPPAWERVWICPYSNGHIQATGRDARGRKQYRYHPRWREERDRNKYSRMVAFGSALPALRRRVDADLKLEGLPRRKVLATVVRLLETTFIRVGNEEYARTNHSFGLTTLKDRHVDFARGEVRFHFRGKSGVAHQVAIHDPRVARIVKRCRDLPGQELFQYLDDDGKIQTIDSAEVNEYIREIAGKDFTAKDFRTWAGTVLATVAFQELAAASATLGAKQGTPAGGKVKALALVSAAGGRAARRQRHPRSGASGVRRDAAATARRVKAGVVAAAARAVMNAPAHRPTQKDVVTAIKQVAERLGNTPSVCRKCYVHPAVIATYLSGKLDAALGKVPRATARGAGSTQTELRAASASGSTARAVVRQRRSTTTGLRPEEAAVLALLKTADDAPVFTAAETRRAPSRPQKRRPARQAATGQLPGRRAARRPTRPEPDRRSARA